MIELTEKYLNFKDFFESCNITSLQNLKKYENSLIGLIEYIVYFTPI